MFASPHKSSETQQSTRRSKLTAEDYASARLLAFASYMAPAYKRAAPHRLIARRLEAVAKGEVRRLAIFMPPRHGKSMLASEMFPPWCLGRRAGLSVIAASHTQDLADDFGRKVRNTIRSDDFRRVFPRSGLRWDSTSVRRFHTANGGTYYAAGVGGPITGRGADLLLIDDPLKNRQDADSPQKRDAIWEWYTSTAYTRLSAAGAIVLIQTRWHPDDLAGRILQQQAEENWEVINLPAVDQAGAALWGEQYPIERLDQIRTSLPAREWESLYMQNPLAAVGGTFSAPEIDPWIGKVAWHESLEPDGHAHICTGVDLATRKGEEHDLTVFATVRKVGHRYQLLNIVARRMEATEILRTMLDVYRRFHVGAGHARFRVEDNAAQAYIVQMAKDAKQMAALGATEIELGRLNVVGATTTRKKRDIELGIPGVAADIEMGRWDFPDHREMKALREEMLLWAPDIHTGDRLMALWIARNGLRTGAPGIHIA